MRIKELKEAKVVYFLDIVTGEYDRKGPSSILRFGRIYALPLKTWRSMLTERLTYYPVELARVIELTGGEKIDKVFTSWWDWPKLETSFSLEKAEEGYSYWLEFSKFLRDERDMPKRPEPKLIDIKELAGKWFCDENDNWQMLTRITGYSMLYLWADFSDIKELHDAGVRYADTYKGELKSLDVRA